MTYRVIEDHSQMKVDDILEYRCPRFGLVTQWRVDGIHLGALRVESLIAVRPITNKPADGNSVVMVPEEMTRSMTIIRGA